MASIPSLPFSISAFPLALLAAMVLVLTSCAQADKPTLLATGPSSTVPTGGTIVVDDGATDDPLSPATAPLEVNDGDATSTSADEAGADVEAGAATSTAPDETTSGETAEADGQGGGEAKAANNDAKPASDGRPLVVYDTDMGPDVDDVLALAMLHTYQDRGQLELAAVTVSRNSVMGARYTDAVNTFYGHPDIPIGIYRNDPTGFDDAGLFVSKANSWPHSLDGDIPDGAAVLRQVLARADAEGRNAIIIQTGFSGNVAQLLRSGGDQYSSKSGVQLVTDTVSVLSIMAGSTDFGIAEFNIERDIDSARYVFSHWPVRLVMSPFELGNSIHYPYSSITSDYNWTDRHPVREAYEFRDLDWHEDAPAYYNMKSWDLTSVIYAIEPQANWFRISGAGTVAVDGAGKTEFKPGSGQHYVLDRYNQYSAGQRQGIINRMIDLSSAKPR